MKHKGEDSKYVGQQKRYGSTYWKEMFARHAMKQMALKRLVTDRFTLVHPPHDKKSHEERRQGWLQGRRAREAARIKWR